jgi:predicted DNA-binding protein YlxM (UPF0122 family)
MANTFISVNEAAKELGCTRQNIHDHMSRGNLTKYYVGNRSVVAKRTEVNALKCRLKKPIQRKAPQSKK